MTTLVSRIKRENIPVLHKYTISILRMNQKEREKKHSRFENDCAKNLYDKNKTSVHFCYKLV